MANHEQLALMEQGVDVWNEWRQRYKIQPDLSGANLSKTNLAFFNLKGANLTRVDLSLANLYEADLQGADLTRANVIGGILVGANLQQSSFVGANLIGTKFIMLCLVCLDIHELCITIQRLEDCQVHMLLYALAKEVNMTL